MASSNINNGTEENGDNGIGNENGNGDGNGNGNTGVRESEEKHEDHGQDGMETRNRDGEDVTVTQRRPMTAIDAGKRMS